MVSTVKKFKCWPVLSITFTHRLFYDINKSIATLEKLETLEGTCFVPSHTPATDDLVPLCRLNEEALRSNKAFILDRCDKRTFEDLFAAVTRDFGIDLDMDKYAKLTFTVRIYLQSLIEDGALTASLESGKLVYHRI